MNKTNERVLITEIIPREKLKNLIQRIWGKVATSRNKAGGVTTPVPVPQPGGQPIQQPIQQPVNPQQMNLFPTKPSGKAPRGKSQQMTFQQISKKKSKGFTPPEGFKLVTPKVTRGFLGSKKFDMTKLPFYNTPLNWLNGVFRGTKYIGPDLSKQGFRIAGNRVKTGQVLDRDTYEEDVLRNAQKYLEEWNEALEFFLQCDPKYSELLVHGQTN